jgi:hypothetical protein
MLRFLEQPQRICENIEIHSMDTGISNAKKNSKKPKENRKRERV